MNRSSAYRFDWVEVLEDRRMFSASPQSLAMNFVATHAPLQATLKATTPNIVGTYSGTVHDSNEKSAGTMTVVIQTQSNGKITGYVDSKYPHEHTHRNFFTAKLSGNSLTVSTSTTSIKVTLSDKDRVMTGSFVFKSSDDSSVGHFVLDRSK